MSDPLVAYGQPHIIKRELNFMPVPRNDEAGAKDDGKSQVFLTQGMGGGFNMEENDMHAVPSSR